MKLYNFIKREYSFNKGKLNSMNKIFYFKKVLVNYILLGDILIA